MSKIIKAFSALFIVAVTMFGSGIFAGSQHTYTPTTKPDFNAADVKYADPDGAFFVVEEANTGPSLDPVRAFFGPQTAEGAACWSMSSNLSKPDYNSLRIAGNASCSYPVQLAVCINGVYCSGWSYASTYPSKAMTVYCSSGGYKTFTGYTTSTAGQAVGSNSYGTYQSRCG